MNVYSLRLIPSLKLKFCEIFGIASTMAISELQNRVDRLEVLLNRIDLRARRATRPQVFFQETPAKVTKPKKKAVLRQAVRKTKPVVAQPNISVSEAAPQEAERVTRPETHPVLLIQADPDTHQAVAEYFGAGVPRLEVQSAAEAMERLAGQIPQAVFFDRLLLGQEDSRAALQGLASAFPAAKLVGLSSYLTLAFSQSMPTGAVDFATFLTKPLQRQNLLEIFGSVEKEEAQKQEA